MTAVDLSPSIPQRLDVRVRTVSTRRRVVDRIVRFGIFLAVLIALLPLAAVLVTVVSKGYHVISWHFFTGDIPRPPNISAAEAAAVGIKLNTRPAMGPAIVGTLLITGLASLLAIPLGVLGAIYLNEYGKQNTLARFIRFMADVMTGVPSIVMGLFIYAVWVLRYGASGQSGLAGALALACLMLPVVIRTSEEMLRLVPDELRRSSLALGTRTWRTIVSVVLPAALPGITSGAMLAVARAAGETAPVIFTIGITSTTNASPSGSNTTLAAQIFANAKNVDPLANSEAWGAALTLITLVFVLTISARIVSTRFSSRHA